MDDIKHRPHVDVHNAISCALQYFLMHTTSAVEVLTTSNASLSMAIDSAFFVVTFASSILNAHKTCTHPGLRPSYKIAYNLSNNNQLGPHRCRDLQQPSSFAHSCLARGC